MRSDGVGLGFRVWDSEVRFRIPGFRDLGLGC